MSKTILVVAAHTDDEALGCGGTIARHVGQGDMVHLLFMTDGVGSREVVAKEADERLSAAEQAANVLGVSSSTHLDFPDNSMDSVPLLDIVKKAEAVISKIAPDIIYTHHIGDLNIDHQIAHKVVLTACRPQPNFSVKAIYSFEVLSSTEWQTLSIAPFLPNVFVDITDHLDTKILAIQAYREEMREVPHSRNFTHVELLAKHRGHTVGIDAAEAFMLVREIK